MALAATYYGSNGWLVEIDSIKILIDPWLEGDLTFPLGKWFFYGRLTQKWEIPLEVDLVLLSQGLSDHTHEPTLAKVRKDIPVICSASCVNKLEKLGFIDIRVIRPREKISFGNLLIEATAGAPVPKTENGYILSTDNKGIYIEPHGYLDSLVSPRKLDAAITPVINLGIPIAGNFIRGKEVLPEIIEKFDPTQVLSSTTGGEISFSGLLNKFISAQGDIVMANRIAGSKNKLIDPIPGMKYTIVSD